ncbi:DUF1801 domain-containing protein [Brevundimonas lenta]|uniref:YdhG-like domain-containing protein n=1 Tax=Brevundimonas lenta TaxID=424796 RepID=A0A7W6JD90_9CAUL|nr:DUF1801 domain-containing protein [Brevundimonas lenta]MBB4082989.1 hypothetical protein [Brevundimonas lenta]
MRKSPPPSSPDAYVAALDGWRRELVERLRAAALSVDGMVEVIKWGHIVYLQDGPALLIRAEEERVLFGFWRGQRLRGIEPRLKPGGKYEMATLDLREGDDIAHEIAVDLARAAAQMNSDLGRPDRPADAD